MKQVDIGSKNCVEVDGDMVKINKNAEVTATWSRSTRMGFNKNAVKPQIAAIKDKYYEMFRNKTKS